MSTKYQRFGILFLKSSAWRSLTKHLNIQIRTVHLDIIKVLFIHQLIH